MTTGQGARTASTAVAFSVACAGVALFSAMDAVMKGLSLEMGVYNAMFWRSIAGSLIGAGWMLARRAPWPSLTVLRLHLKRGAVVTVMAALFFWGLTRLPIAEAIALSFIAPLIALYLAALLLDETIGREAIIASVLGVIGVGVILNGRLRGDYAGEALWGVAAILVSAVLFAWNLILQRQQAQVAGALEVAFFQSLVMFGVLALLSPVWAVLPDAPQIAPVLGAAMLAFSSAFLLSWAYARAEAQVLIPVEYTAFLWAALLGWLVFGERLTFITILGTMLIVAGCLIAARRRPALAHVQAEIA